MSSLFPLAKGPSRIPCYHNNISSKDRTQLGIYYLTEPLNILDLANFDKMTDNVIKITRKRPLSCASTDGDGTKPSHQAHGRKGLCAYRQCFRACITSTGCVWQLMQLRLVSPLLRPWCLCKSLWKPRDP